MNKRRNRVFLLVPAAAAVLLLLPFHLLTGQFNTEHQLFTSSFGQDGPKEIAQNQDLDLYVQGTNLLTGGMVGSLVEALEENVYIGQVTLHEGPPQKTDRPVMVVRVDQADLLWIPVYGHAQVKLHISYATNGEVDWMDDEVIGGVSGPYTKYISGDFSAGSNAFGLASMPGYAAYLGQHFGERISDAIAGALKD